MREKEEDGWVYTDGGELDGRVIGEIEKGSRTCVDGERAMAIYYGVGVSASSKHPLSDMIVPMIA